MRKEESEGVFTEQSKPVCQTSTTSDTLTPATHTIKSGHGDNFTTSSQGNTSSRVILKHQQRSSTHSIPQTHKQAENLRKKKLYIKLIWFNFFFYNLQNRPLVAARSKTISQTSLFITFIDKYSAWSSKETELWLYHRMMQQINFFFWMEINLYLIDAVGNKQKTQRLLYVPHRGWSHSGLYKHGGVATKTSYSYSHTIELCEVKAAIASRSIC